MGQTACVGMPCITEPSLGLGLEDTNAEDTGQDQIIPRTITNRVQGIEVIDLGASLAFLKDFATEHIEEVVRERMTTGEVNQHLVMLRVTENGNHELDQPRSYAQLGRDRGLLDSQGQPAFAQATVLVAQSWCNSFHDLIDALEAWLEESGSDSDQTYFWLDIFSVAPGHGGWSNPESWWSDRYMKTIGAIGNTIVFAEPWTSPTTFVDPWAIWQFYCTTVTGARLHLAMGPEQRRCFTMRLMRSFEEVRSTLAEVKVCLSGTSSPDQVPARSLSKSKLGSMSMSHVKETHTSRHHIIDEIQRVVSFERLNEVLQTRLRHWLAQCAKEELRKLFAQTSGDSQTPGDIWRHLTPNELSLRDHVGQMLREMGNLSEGEEYFRKLKVDCEKRLGLDSAFTLAVTNQLAVTLQKFKDNAKRDEAAKLHRELLKRRQSSDGEDSPSALQTASNLGVLLTKQFRAGVAGVLDEAIAMTSQAYAGRQSLFGMKDPRTLYTATTLAILLSAMIPQGKASEAEVERATKLHEDAAEGLATCLGSGHPLTLRASQHRAEHWLTRAEYTSDKDLCKKAYNELADILSKQTVKLGREHDQTQETKELAHRARKALAGMDFQKTSNDDGDNKLLLRDMSQEERPWREFQPEVFHQINTADHFVSVRRVLRQYGVGRLLTQLRELGFVDDAGMLTTTTKPFNVFARIGAGIMVQDTMQEDQLLLGEFQDRFLVACNRPECDENWESMDPAWLGKASMAKHHRFLIMKDLHWRWFNVLVFGMVDDNLQESIQMLEDLQQAANVYIKGKGWPENVGFFFHVYSLSSVNSLHLHLVDLDNTGPTYDKMVGKNILLTDVLRVLQQELKSQQSMRSLSTLELLQRIDS